MAIQRDEIVAKALDLLDESGLEGLTMRRLADAFEVKAASLYWHFTNKQALLDSMADALMAGVAREPAATDWTQALRTTAHEVRRALLARRDGAQVYAGTYVPTDNVLRVAEALIAALRAGGASTRLAAWGAANVVNFILGAVIEEQGMAALSAATADLDSRKATLTALAQARYPNVYAARDDITSADVDARFDAGLDLLVLGMQARIAAPD